MPRPEICIEALCAVVCAFGISWAHRGDAWAHGASPSAPETTAKAPLERDDFAGGRGFTRAFVGSTAFLQPKGSVIVDALELLLWGVTYSPSDGFAMQLRFFAPLFFYAPNDPALPKMAGFNGQWRILRAPHLGLSVQAGYNYLGVFEQVFHETRVVLVASWCNPHLGTMVSGYGGLQAVRLNGAAQPGLIAQLAAAQRIVPELFLMFEVIGNATAGQQPSSRLLGPGTVNAFQGVGGWGGARMVAGDFTLDLGAFTGLAGDFDDAAIGSEFIFWINMQYRFNFAQEAPF